MLLLARLQLCFWSVSPDGAKCGADPELPEVFHVAEHIVENDSRVRAALEASAG